MALTLTREVRFGLHDEPTPSGADTRSANGFAGNPGLWDIAPFLTLAATVVGDIDPATGMMVNIKHVDRVLREKAVPLLRRGYYDRPQNGAGRMLVDLLQALDGAFVPHQLRRLQLGLSPYLTFAIENQEASVVQLSVRFEFSAAHRLHSATLSEADNWDVFGRCNNPNGHGHNYELEVTVAGEPDPHTGTVMPVADLQRIVNERVIDVYDHKHLNLDCDEFRPPAGVNPTVENIARAVHGRLKGQFPGQARLAAVRVWETPKTMCEFRE